MLSKKLKSCILISSFAFGLCSCGGNHNANQPAVSAPDAVTTTQESSADTSTATDLMKFDVGELQCGFYISNDVADILESDDTYTEETVDDLAVQRIEFFTTMDEVKQPLFQLWKIDGTYSEEDLSSHNPMLAYIPSDSKDFTYAILFTEEPVEDLLEDNVQKFNDIMNHDVSKIPENFYLLTK